MQQRKTKKKSNNEQSNWLVIL